jgi:transposase InsO family protein
MNSRKENYLRSIYYEPSHPSSFAGVDKLHRAVKKEGKHSISKYRIKQWLSKQSNYTEHKPVRRNFKRRRVVVDIKNAQWDGDTVSMVRYVEQNSSFRYILVIIDILSRFVWTVPLKNLKGKEMVDALKGIFREVKPRKLRTDKGSEFSNKHVNGYLRKEGVDHFTTTNETKANFSERVIKTLKTKITKYLDKKQSHKWLDILADMTLSYNSSYHRSIKMTPNEALQTDDAILWRIQYALKPVKSVKPEREDIKREKKVLHKSKNPFNFQIGDQVKLSHMRGAFDKDYDEKWTREIYFITGRQIKDDFAVYKIKAWNNDPIIGTFYESELQKIETNEDEVYNIEKIIRKRKRGGKTQVLIKWQGWGKEYNSWLDEKEIRDL